MKQTPDDKDLQILKLLAEGLTIKEISGKVYLSCGGIRFRVREIRKHLNAKNTNELISKAYTKGYLKIQHIVC